MTKLTINAILAEANAKEAKAVANLNNYMTNSVGVGEHPDIVAECTKLIKEIAEAREIVDTINSMTENVNEETTQDS